MKIELRSLHVKGCGPLEDVTIDFTDAEGKPRPVTVIAGANGSGKTTVLELIVDSANKFSPKFARSPISEKTNLEIVEAVYSCDESNVTVIYGAPKETVKKVEHFENRTVIDFSPSLVNRNTPLTTQSGFISPANIGNEIKKQIEGILRSQGKVPFDKKQYSDGIPSILLFPHPRKIHPVRGTQLSDEETLYNWVYQYENAQNFQGSLDAYLCWLAFIEPERPGVFTEVTEFLDSLDFDGKKFNLKRTKLKATVTTREGHTHFLEELSAGEQNILIMLLELRRRLLPGSIVLIDEIESSLHEAYQHMLAQALLKIQRDIPFQLIVTTHSKTIAKIFGWDSVVILTDF